MPRGGKRSTSFKPGKSANPGGKPTNPAKIAERKIKAEAIAQAKADGCVIIDDIKIHSKSHTSEAFNTWLNCIRDEAAPWAAKNDAAMKIIERGWGRSPQTIEGEVSVRHTLEDYIAASYRQTIDHEGSSH